jgi:hypothetical protein
LQLHNSDNISKTSTTTAKEDYDVLKPTITHLALFHLVISTSCFLFIFQLPWQCRDVLLRGTAVERMPQVMYRRPHTRLTTGTHVRKMSCLAPHQDRFHTHPYVPTQRSRSRATGRTSQMMYDWKPPFCIGALTCGSRQLSCLTSLLLSSEVFRNLRTDLASGEVISAPSVQQHI